VIPTLNAHAIRSVGKAIQTRSLHDKVCPSWASGEPRVRLPTEGDPRVRREFVQDYCPCPRLGSDEVASLDRRSPRFIGRLWFVLKTFSSRIKVHWRYP
jgi:hypothetical protein